MFQRAKSESKPTLYLRQWATRSGTLTAIVEIPGDSASLPRFTRTLRLFALASSLLHRQHYVRGRAQLFRQCPILRPPPDAHNVVAGLSLRGLRARCHSTPSFFACGSIVPLGRFFSQSKFFVAPFFAPSISSKELCRFRTRHVPLSLRHIDIPCPAMCSFGESIE